MGLRADSARPQRIRGSARTHSRHAESARNPIASHVNFGDDSALSAFTRTQWTAAFIVITSFSRSPQLSSLCSSGGRFMRVGDKIRLPDDVTMGYIIGKCAGDQS